jgi:transcriptional regulator with XRE-family HTH domain
MERSSWGRARWQTNLRKLRLRAGLTEQALAAKLGVTYHTIQAWESARCSVRKEWLLKLGEALDCSAVDLLRPAEGVARRAQLAARPWDAEE